jgi:hypothetical protein
MHERRARTRRLIELGGLVAKSRVPELLGPAEPDPNAALLGALLELADRLEQPTAPAHRARWRDRGRAAFRAAAPQED